MEQTDSEDPDDCACPCCQVPISGIALDEAGGCNLCTSYPYTEAWTCSKKHGDALRVDVVAKVLSGSMSAWEAVARCAADDAHRAGHLREYKAGPGLWSRWIDQPAPDPFAWERMCRLWSVERTIHQVVAWYVGPEAKEPWNAGKFRQTLIGRLSKISRSVGCSGIWSVSVGSPMDVQIQPPSDFIGCHGTPISEAAAQ